MPFQLEGARRTVEMAVMRDGSPGGSGSTSPSAADWQRAQKRHTWSGNALISFLSGSSKFFSTQDDEPPLADMPVAVNEVTLVEQDHEWGGGADSSSSDSSTPPRARARAVEPVKAVDFANEPVAVVEVEKEWEGGLGDSSDDEDVSATIARRGEERRRQLKEREDAVAAASSTTFSAKATPEPSPQPRPSQVTPRRSRAGTDASTNTDSSRSSRGPPPRSRSFIRRDLMAKCWRAAFGWYGGFLAFTLVHLGDFVLRMWSIAEYIQSGLEIPAYVWLVPLQVIGALLSIYITFHDADVLLILHNTSGWAKVSVAILSFLFLGCCQVIQVKRAWSRQMHDAEVVIEMSDNDLGVARKESTYDDRAANASSLHDFGAAERITPVALLTGVPFLLVHAMISAQYVQTRQDHQSWWLTTCVLIMTVSFGIVDIDVSVSSYVVKRYQMNSQSRIPRWMQRLFKPLHVLYRVSEVCLRLAVLSGLVTVQNHLQQEQQEPWVLIALVLADYCLGVYLLIQHSPQREGAVVHIFTGIGLLVADLGHFIDMPNFSLAARRISRRLVLLRLTQLIALLGVYHWVFWREEDGSFYDGLVHAKWTYIFGLVHYSVRISRPISKLGQDLHTAALDGDLPLTRKLLKPDQNGQVLDVNATAKDGRGMTPLMLAAAAGHVEVIEELVHNGARVGLHTAFSEETALHYAVRHQKVEACKVLLKQGAKSTARDAAGNSPKDLARSSKLHQLFVESEMREETHEETFNNSTSRRMTYRSVKAKPVAGLQLRSLFPNLEKDEAPSPRVLQSVSALVVSKAAGPLSRRALSRSDDNSGSVPLGALRRVRELGRGGFGRVIEVELPRDAASSIWRRPVRTQRFALKLQLKQDHRQASSEVLALQRAEHAFIVHLHRAFAFNKYLALLLELCPTDLNRMLCEPAEEGGRCLGLAPDLAARYMGQVMLALAYLHENKIVYRDVKPENILVSTLNEAKLTDFGLAKVVTSAERMTMCGTMGFLSPELTGVGAVLSTASLMSSDASGVDSEVFNPFKTDAYSFGVTIQVTLLGEDGARKKTVKRKGPMMLPLHLSETENAELLQQLREAGRLCPEGENLLVEKLLPFSQPRRAELTDPEVKNHPFFCKYLKCKDVEDFLLSQAGKETDLMSP